MSTSKNGVFVLVVVVLVLAAFASVAHAARPAKATFTGADCAGLTCTIEATAKSSYTTCRYFEPDEFSDYAVYLGRYDQAVTTVDLLAFCQAHFGERIAD